MAPLLHILLLPGVSHKRRIPIHRVNELTIWHGDEQSGNKDYIHGEKISHDPCRPEKQE